MEAVTGPDHAAQEFRLPAARSAGARRRAPKARSRFSATTQRGSAPSTPARPCAPGIRLRRRPCWRRPTRNTPSACERPRTAGASTASCRRRTSWPPSALPSAAAGTGRAPSPPPLGPGISLMSEFLGLAYFAEVPVVLFNVQRGGPSTGMPTRTQQAEIPSWRLRLARRHEARPGCSERIHNECFSLGAQAFDLAERLQTPVIVMSDLDIGMNEWVTEPFAWDEKRAHDRGKVLDAKTLESFKERRAGTGAATRTSTATPSPTARCRARSDQGRVLHPRHLAQRGCPLHRGRPHPRARPRPHPPQVRHCRHPGAQARDRIRDKGGKTGLIYFGANTAGGARGARSPSSARASRSTPCGSRPSPSPGRSRPSAPRTSASSWSSKTATRRCARCS